MGKKKVFLILLLCIILAMGVTLWSNATFRTIFRALFHLEYPVETQKIKNDIVEFDLSDKKPARLAIGLRYSRNAIPKEIKDRERDENIDYKIDGEIEVKLYKNNKLIKSDLITSIDRVSYFFSEAGYKTARFYTFDWSPNIIVKPKGKVKVDLKGKFRNSDLILHDAGIK